MQTFNLVQIPPAELRQLIRQELEAYFNEKKIEVKQEQPVKQIVDIDGLCKARPELGKKSTIYKKTMKGLIPHSKSGKKLLFDLAKVDAHTRKEYLSNEVKTVEQTKADTMDKLRQSSRV